MGAVSAAILGAAILGGAMQNKAAGDARKAARKQRDREAEMMDAERERQEAATQRQFEAQTEDWTKTTSNLDKWANYWDEVSQNPGEMHPDFSTYKREVEQAGKVQQQGLSDMLRRRGIVGGEQTRVAQDINTKVQQTLTNALTQITKQAQDKVFQIENMRPAKPYLGQPKTDYSVIQPPQNFGNLGPVDLSGFGMMLAQQQDGKDEDEISTLDRSGTVTPPPVDDIYQTIDNEDDWIGYSDMYAAQ